MSSVVFKRVLFGNITMQSAPNSVIRLKSTAPSVVFGADLNSGEHAAISDSTNIERSVVDILVVEDNPDEAGLMLYAIRENNVGDSVHVVNDGQEAIDFLLSTGRYSDRKNLPKPRLVLLDIKLPLVSGFEVLRQVKGNESTRAIPIIVMTSSRMETDLDQCYDLGANSYIVKPLDFDKFSEIVRMIGYYWLRLNQLPEGAPPVTPPL